MALGLLSLFCTFEYSTKCIKMPFHSDDSVGAAKTMNARLLNEYLQRGGR